MLKEEETLSFTNRHSLSGDGDMKTLNSVEKTKVSSRPVENIEPDMMARRTTSPTRLSRCASKVMAEWQERGPEILSGLTVRKLRLSLAPSQLMVAASAAG